MGIDVKATGQKIYNLSVNKFGSANKVADYLGISKQAVSYWRNKAKMPDIENMVIIADSIGCKVDDLLVRTE